MRPTRVLSYNDDDLFIQKGKELLLVNAVDGKTQKRWQLPYARFIDLDRRAIRLLRSGVHALLPLKNEKVILVLKKLICRLDLTDGSVDGLFSEFQGSRPLFICQTNAGDIYFGDYFNNPDRDTVNIYHSPDLGETYQIIYSFPPNTIRHIHGLFFDPYTDNIWVTSGDHDQESNIWKTGDNFKNLDRVVGGEQRFRAVQLIFTKDFIYYGSDTPLELNFLYRLNRRTKEVEKLQQVQGTVFYGCKVGSDLFFSTVVEPSIVNTDPHVYIWGSKDGKSWKCVKKYRKDLFPMKLFQYGQILFPRGENKTDNLWFTPLSTRKDLTLQCMTAKGMLGDQ